MNSEQKAQFLQMTQGGMAPEAAPAQNDVNEIQSPWVSQMLARRAAANAPRPQAAVRPAPVITRPLIDKAASFAAMSTSRSNVPGSNVGRMFRRQMAAQPMTDGIRPFPGGGVGPVDMGRGTVGPMPPNAGVVASDVGRSTIAPQGQRGGIGRIAAHVGGLFSGVPRAFTRAV